MQLNYPELDVPFPMATNAFTDRAEEHGRQFVRRFDLVATAAARKHFDESLLGTLVGRACPRADRPTLELVADWMGCNLVLDDLFDETGIGQDPRSLREFCDKVLSWLPEGGPVTEHDGSPFARAYTDLWERTCAHMGPTWRRRFTRHFGLFLDRCVWEAKNRKDGSTPAVDEYLRMRACAFMPYVDLLEVTSHWEIPQEIYDTEIVGELNLSLSECVLWTNDLFSCEKEYRLGDVHNLVVVLCHAKNIDLQTAADVVSEMVQNRINDFVVTTDEFLDQLLPERYDAALRSALTLHIANMRSWLRGQLQWRYETKRNDDSNLQSVDGIAVRNY